jgi:UDP-N-acetylmuramoylalanine--D-glutamate ligase
VRKKDTSVELEGLKVLVVGLARTGASLVKFLLEKRAQVRVTDQKGEEELGDMAKGLEAHGCLTRFGGHAREDFLTADLIVISPGVPFSMSLLQEAVSAGVEVISEVELAACFLTCPIIAVTGTNGKTTTVSLISEMLRRGRINAFVGGNIGRPLIDCVYETETRVRPSPTFVVAELSKIGRAHV